MKSAASSPRAHLYRLAKLAGKNADIIRALNARAFPLFGARDVQVLSWALQAGTAYDALSAQSKKIVDSVLPEFRQRLKGSFLDSFGQKWDAVARQVPQLPPFSSVTDEALNELGTVGAAVRSLRSYQETIRRNGHDYSSLSNLIEVPGLSPSIGDAGTTPWSVIAPRVYARFLTEGSFQQAGRLELRVLPPGKTTALGPRSLPSFIDNVFGSPAFAEQGSGVLVDVSGIQGDPGTGGVQPLSFALILGIARVAGIRKEAVAIFAAAIASAIIVQNWSAIYDGIEKGKNPVYWEAKDVVDRATQMAKEAHDELERDARDKGLVDGTANDTTRDPGNKTRQYDKPGGREQQARDWEKLPYPQKTASDGTKTKSAPDGTTYVERTEPSRTSPPTIEIQPPDAGGGNNPTRIKIRYP